MKRNDNVLEEVDMLVTEGHCKARNNSGEDVENLSSAIELMLLVDEIVEGIGEGLADHLAARHYLGVYFMEDSLEVLAFIWLLRIEQFQEFMDKLRSYVHLDRLRVASLVQDQLHEELVDPL